MGEHPPEDGRDAATHCGLGPTGDLLEERLDGPFSRAGVERANEGSLRVEGIEQQAPPRLRARGCARSPH
jgi:hypothetical protein